MAKKQSESKIKSKKVEFLLYAPQAQTVSLLGDFNQWDDEKSSMKKGKAGEWKKVLMLTPGNYEYKYRVDGHWQEDPAHHPHRLNAFGTYNNLLRVKE